MIAADPELARKQIGYQRDLESASCVLDSDFPSAEQRIAVFHRKADKDAPTVEKPELKFAKHRHGLLKRLFRVGDGFDEKKLLSWKKARGEADCMVQIADEDACCAESNQEGAAQAESRARR
mgnify:CR=1 FL=1